MNYNEKMIEVTFEKNGSKIPIKCLETDKVEELINRYFQHIDPYERNI